MSAHVVSCECEDCEAQAAREDERQRASWRRWYNDVRRAARVEGETNK